MAGSDPDPDIADLFCHYNALYFHGSLGACAVSWAQEPLPYGTLSDCDYYPGGGGCIVLLSKSLYECHPESDLKNVLLHEMIHAYMCVKNSNTNHSDHGPNFQKLMNTINSSSVSDAHRPIGGYSVIMPHEIRKKHQQYKCGRCGDLVKSTKVRGPSHEDCIEGIGANYSCPNSTCQWHSHKKRCSGSYYIVRESPTCRVRPKGSIASAEETLVEHKADESASGSWHAKHTSNNCRTSNKHEREDASTEFLHPAGNAIGNSELGSSSGERSSKKIKLSKDIGFDLMTSRTFQQVPKRPRTINNQECSRQKKRKISKWDGSYSIIIGSLNYYFIDNSEEDEVPLINKRTERRKRQKLLQSSQAMKSNNGAGVRPVPVKCFDSCSQGPGDDRSENAPASQVGDRLLPHHPVSNHVVTADQTGHETVSSQLDSPMVGEIVDILDG